MENLKRQIRIILWRYRYMIKPHRFSEYVETVLDEIIRLFKDGKI